MSSISTATVPAPRCPRSPLYLPDTVTRSDMWCVFGSVFECGHGKKEGADKSRVLGNLAELIRVWVPPCARASNLHI